MPGDEIPSQRDAATIAGEWVGRVERLLDADRETDPAASLVDFKRRLDAIREGQRLRRQLDLMLPEPGSRFDLARTELVNNLGRLRLQLDDRELGDLAPDSRKSLELTRRLKGDLNEVRLTLRTTMANPRGNPLGQGLVLEGLRSDIEWMGRIIARIDKEKPLRIVSLLEVELHRLDRILGTDSQSLADPESSILRRRCAHMQNALLERRVDREILRAPSDLPEEPEECWARRFTLSKLQAQADAIDLASEGEDASEALGEKRARWNAGIAVMRETLADRADLILSKRPRTERLASRERVLAAAHEEVNETIAFLEELSLTRAVSRLELARDDLERLARSCDAWKADEFRLIAQEELGQVPDRGRGADETEDVHEVLEAQSEAVPLLLREEETVQQRLTRNRSRVRRLIAQVQREWQEKLLALRLERLLGPRFAARLETTVLALILLLSILMVAEWAAERLGPLGPLPKAVFAWADLAICSVFLFEFFLKLYLAPRRGSFFLRRFVIDFVASIPFGFLVYQADLIETGGAAVSRSSLGRLIGELLRYGRFAQLLRYVRLALPALRIARLALFALRFSDRMVRRMAGLLNRNIILFEPAHSQRPESGFHYRLAALRAELDHANTQIESRMDLSQRHILAARLINDLESVLDRLTSDRLEETDNPVEVREIPVEAVVEQLIQMTPERLIDRMGPAFVVSADRYIRLFDVPFVRRLPMIRSLVAHREKSHAEAVTLATNYIGYLIQRGLDIIYFLADLHGTVSPPVFLDRLGAAIINATSKPAKRLLWLGSATFVLFAVVQLVPILAPYRRFVDKLQNLLGWPVIILGVICFGLWMLGSWFRRIANQSADFCERVVEAQFATQTKSLKAKRQEHDARFLAERVIDPEILLRSSDDGLAVNTSYKDGDEDDQESKADIRGPDVLFQNRELAFLRNLRLLYQDYLDGSPLHRSDNKASIQLLGNLALANMRRSHLGHLLKESRALDRLDLSRAGGLFGGAFLWFNYVTRMIVQDTALLLLDYNRHAIPLDRLMCSPEKVRVRFRTWLARRLKVDEDLVQLPDRVIDDPEEAASESQARPTVQSTPRSAKVKRRREARMFFETVEFTAIDFLADDPERDQEIRARFGDQVAELVRLDRQQNVRRAFRSFPLHELPLSQRTFNLYALYENNLAGGRIVVLPFRIAALLFRSIWIASRNLAKLVRAILNPNVDLERNVPSDTYWAARRKIHRMRKPVFMGTLWLRARFDVEYLGLPLPSAPPGIASQSLLETDLDVIGATRRDRIIVEHIRQGHQKRLAAVSRWLDRFGWTFHELPHRLIQEIPFLTNRGGEALRAIVTACTLDHDDIATLGLSIEALTRIIKYVGDPDHDPAAVPPGLPDPVTNTRLLWYPVHRCRRTPSDLFLLPCFPTLNKLQQRRVLSYLRRHRRMTRGWIRVVLGQGGVDPWETLKHRLRKVLLRTDLWSDQMIVLRAVQTLTMLDLQHNCELVWNLGGYQESDTNEAEGGETEASAPYPSGSVVKAEADMPSDSTELLTK